MQENRHAVNKVTRDIVREAAQYGVTPAAIGAILGAHLRRSTPISGDQIPRQYQDELRQGNAMGIYQAAQVAWERATGRDGQPPDTSLTRWWLERRDPASWQAQPDRVEIGRAGDFEKLTDQELLDKIRALESVDSSALDGGE